MACEVFISQVIIVLMERERWPDPTAWADSHTGGFSLLNLDIRERYVTLSKDRISRTFPRWKEYQQHVQLRNKVAHRGERVTASDATVVCEVAAALATHLQATLAQAP
jgi:hypothetical protein